jgi:hypothetical protein
MRMSRDSLMPFCPAGGGDVGMGYRLGEQEDEQRAIGGQEWDGGDEGRDLWVRGRNLWLRIFRFWSRERDLWPRGRNLRLRIFHFWSCERDLLPRGWNLRLRIFHFWSREREFWGCGGASGVWFLTFRQGRSGGGVSVGPGFRLFLNGEPLLLQRQPREVC